MFLGGIRRKITKALYPDQHLAERFMSCHGHPLNLENPRSLSEKVLWLKRHVDLEPLSIFTDKFAVRDYVREQIGSNYLIPLIGIYDHVNEIDLDALPDSFMIKTTHSSGWNIRVTNKAQVNWHRIKKKLKRWLSQCFYERHGEANYRGIKPRIMIEPLLSEDQGELRDYKLYFCNGEYLGAHVDFNRFSDHQHRVYDVAWNEFEKENPNTSRNFPICPRPEKLDEMIDIGLKLSQGFPFVRVDLYYPQGQIFFGELTFTPGNGLSRFDPIESDFYFGAPFHVLHYLNTPYYEPHWTPTPSEDGGRGSAIPES